MTNEQLAELAQDPENSELVPVLWEKVHDLLYMKAYQAYNEYKTAFDCCGVELSDIRQECYFVFLEALKYYKPQGGYKFNTYFALPFKGALQRLWGTKSGKRNPLNAAASLEKHLTGMDGAEGEKTLADILPSKINIEREVTDIIEKGEERAAVRYAVNRLSEPLRDVINRYYFQDETLEEIAEAVGITKQAILIRRDYALSLLRRSAALRRLYRAQEKHITWKNLSHMEWKPQYFDDVNRLRE